MTRVRPLRSQPSVGTAGKLNVTMRFEASLRGGMPRSMPMSYDFDVNGVAYQYQQYAEVTAVSPSVGSTAGGAVLTISGRGFPTLSLGLNDTVVVSVQGVPCTVLSSTYSTITCRTGPQPATDPLSATPLRGQYPGMRGIEYEFYNLSRNNPVSPDAPLS
jgi:hypothetical protein